MRKRNDASNKTTRSHTRRPELWAPVCALALVAIVAGNVAAIPLKRDDDRSARQWIGVSPHIAAKLGTKAGYQVLVFG